MEAHRATGDGDPPGATRDIPIHVPDGSPVTATLRFEFGGDVELEQADVYTQPHDVGGSLVGRAMFRVPSDLPLGWHVVEARFPGRRGRGYVVVTPEAIQLPPAVDARKPWGFMTQLYSLRSRARGALAIWGPRGPVRARKISAGADFVLINPLHANEVVPPLSASPYLPTSRRFMAPMYIRIEDIPEVAYVPSQQRAVIEWEFERPSRANATDDLSTGTRRGERNLRLSSRFSRPLALQAERLSSRLIACGKARDSRTTRHGPRSPSASRRAVARTSSRPRRPLAWPHGVTSMRTRVASTRGCSGLPTNKPPPLNPRRTQAGMDIGVITDLAVGVHPQGADAWSLTVCSRKA